MTVNVKWEGQVSGDIIIQQGIRQGAVLSALLYKHYNNSILDSIQRSGLGMHIGDIPCASPTCADDIALIANTPHEAQALLDLVHFHTDRDLVKINPEKSEVVTYSKQKVETSLKFNNNSISDNGATTHLGIHRTRTNKPDIDSKIKIARNTIYALLGSGMYARKGMSPVTAHKLWRTYAIPRSLYGLELFNLTKKDERLLELHQRKILRQIQGLPNNTSSIAVYVLLGAEPTSLTIEKNVLSLFLNIAKNPGSIEYNIIRRSLVMDDLDANKFINRVTAILEKYNLPTVGDIIRDPPTKYAWKKLVRKKTNIYWYESWRTDQEHHSSLKYLQIPPNPIGQPHPVWKSAGSNPVEIKKAEIKVRLLTSTYKLDHLKAKYSSVSSICKLCQENEEDVYHFLVGCRMLSDSRDPILQLIKQFIEEKARGSFESIINNDLLIQLLLDPTSERLKNIIKLKWGEIERLEKFSRRLCSVLHMKRVKLLSDMQQ